MDFTWPYCRRIKKNVVVKQGDAKKGLINFGGKEKGSTFANPKTKGAEEESVVKGKKRLVEKRRREKKIKKTFQKT